MTDFFIRRPILASSIAILMVLAGVVSMFTLPIAQFPKIVPGTINVTTAYPGASADFTADIITTPLEQQINGAEGMIYMSSTSSSNGVTNITVTFEVDYDLNIGQVEIQNAVQQALGQLPEEVQQVGIDISKQATDIVALISLTSPNGTHDGRFLGNYAQINLVDPLERVPGVGSVLNFGLREYAIRIWLDPVRMAELGLDASTVANVIKNQNSVIPVGSIGQAPVPGQIAFEYQLSALGQLPTPEDFAAIILRTGEDGAVVRLGDVGRVELGAQDYGWVTTLNGHDTGTLAVFQRPDANTFDVLKGVDQTLAKLSDRFPGDLEYAINYKSTTFVQKSMRELVVTLLQAIGLVVLVVFIFLQSARSTIIPTVAIPVALVGTFAVLAGAGFSINILTLLGLVLAVGLVVDDSIVVVENVERRLSEGKNVDPQEATSKAMKDVGGSIVATTVVLLAVFVPASFAPGATGRLFNQFALTIAFSVTLSAINSLTLSPALCALMLRSRKKERIAVSRWFSNGFDAMSRGYAKFVGVLCKLWIVIVVIFAALLWVLVIVGKQTHQSFVPVEDQGWCFVFVELPPGSSNQRTNEIVAEVSDRLSKEPTVENIIAVGGYNFLESYEVSNAGVVFVLLKDWSERTTPDSQVPGLLQVYDDRLRDIPGAVAVAIAPPTIPGLGSTGGIEFEILDTEGQGSEALQAAMESFVDKAKAAPEIKGLLPTFTAKVPQLYLDIDRERAELLDVPVQNVYRTLQIYLGSVYINNWNQYGQVYQVRVQAEGDARQRIDDIGDLYVANRAGDMIQLDQIVEVKHITAPDAIQRYNLYQSALLIGAPADGYSGAQAIKAMVRIATESLIPNGFDYAWTGLVYQELDVAKYLGIIFLLSLVTVFFVLSGLYESWTLPFVILLSVPLAILGAFIALKLRHLPLDVYGQVALLMMIALAAKNQILIVAFAKSERESGKGILESAMNAARIRLRPILMTKSAFIIGVLPMVFATGPGANTRHSIGTTVVGGMLAAAILSLLFVPVVYVIIEWIRSKLGFVPKAVRSTPAD